MAVLLWLEAADRDSQEWLSYRSRAWFQRKASSKMVAETSESILNAHSDQRGETTNGRGDHTARRITGSTAPGAIRNATRCGCASCRDGNCAAGTENQGAQTQATLLR